MTSTEEITAQLVRHRRALFAYIFTILRDHHLSEDVFQEVSLVLVNRYTEREDVRNFWSLAREIARRTARAAQRRATREPVLLSDEAMEALDRGFEQIGDEVDDRKAALHACVDRLPKNWRQIVRLRYWRGLSVSFVAEELGRSVNTISVTLNRIRSRLADCVNAQLRKTAET
ncbi:MAG: sigma-70 family RNA polymerase sigma factor [Kiritimatiellae bacterium]|nr:sigma-70 family RNA polymerase sigma factor [Kiritimatiellia bacterium]